MSGRTSRRELRVERLENKTLLAGDVTVEVVDGNLLLHGDELDNQVLVRGTEEPGEFVIVGLVGSDGQQTTVNGAAEPVVVEGVRRNVRAMLGEGDDLIRLVGARIRGNAVIQTGAGNDRVEIGHAVRPAGELPDAAALDESGPGTDPAEHPDRPPIHRGVTVGRNLVIRTGPGDDVVSEVNVAVRRNQIINTGIGDDRVRLGRPLELAPEPPPADDLNAEPSDPGRPGDPNEPCGPGQPADRPHRPQVAVGGRLVVRLGPGDDALRASATRVGGQLHVRAGRGDDTVVLDRVAVDGLARIGMGRGDDRLVLEQVRARTGLVGAGAGDDTVTVLDSVFARLGMWLRSGDDILRVGGTRVRHAALLDGGAGVDELERLGGNSAHRVTVRNFERPADDDALGAEV